jgi:hypothetical protein
MRGMYIACAAVVFLLFAVLISHAATNLNSSKSNVYRLIYSTDTVSPAQAAAILADLDAATQQSQGRINLEGAVSEALTKQGLGTRIKKTIIQPAGATRPLTTIIILSNPADEAQALAVSDGGTPADKSKGKTN